MYIEFLWWSTITRIWTLYSSQELCFCIQIFIYLDEKSKSISKISFHLFLTWVGRPNCRLGSRLGIWPTCTSCAYEDFGWPLHASTVRPWFLFWSVDLTADRCCPTVVVNRWSIAEPSLAIFDPMTILLKFGLAFNHQRLIFSLIHLPYIYVTTVGNY